MDRLNKFKEIRTRKRNFIILIFLTFSMAVLGLVKVDYSINEMLKNKKNIEIFSMRIINNKYFRIAFVGNKIYLNIKYIQKDFNKLKRLLKV